MQNKKVYDVSEILDMIEDTYRCAPHTIDRHNILHEIDKKIHELRKNTIDALNKADK